MKKIISDNCQELIQFISASDFHNSIYLLLASAILIAFIFLNKAVFNFYKSRKFATGLLLDFDHSEKFIALVEKLNLRNQIYIFKSNKLMAFCYGIKNPKIYISTSIASLKNDQELEAVIRHEQYHLQHKDPLVVFGLNLFESIFGFLPWFKSTIRNIQIKQEIKADSYSVKSLGDNRPLLSVIKKILEESQDNFSFVPGIGKYETLEPRIYALTNKDFKNKRIGIANTVFSILTIFLIWIVVLIPVYAHEVSDEGTKSQLLCSQKERQNASYPYTPAN